MFDRIDTWSNKPLNIKVFFTLAITLFVCVITPWIVHDIYDNDMYFLIATGKEIIKNGIPDVNVWSIDRSPGFVVQQWLYAVILAFVSNFGVIGYISFVVIELTCMILLIVHFFRLKKVSNTFIILSLAIIMIFSKTYMFNLRPQLMTIILLLIQCIGLEHYKQSGKALWLVSLPLSMLFEINLHGSMWPIHYAILLAYIVPAFYLKSVGKNSLNIKSKALWISILIMTTMLFINPYGIDNITYIIKSFEADSFSYIVIQELPAPSFVSKAGICIIVNIALIGLCMRFKTIKSTSLNIAVGLTLMTVATSRNMSFEPIVLLYLLPHLYEHVKTQDINTKGDANNAVGGLLVVAICLFGLNCAGCLTKLSFKDPTQTFIQTACNYISEQDVENPRIFTGFNVGGYFEWQGFDNIYIDARPELYTDDFTGSKNIIAEYSTYCIRGTEMDKSSPRYKQPVTREAMQKWFDGYDFDYVFVTNGIEPHLSAFMLVNDDYKVVESCCNKDYILYEKV